MYTVTSVAGCGGNLTAPSGGPVTSPNYPGNYGNNENCEWSITVPEGSIIRLTFDSFHTEEDYDFLTIYDGASDNAAEMEKLTGYRSQIIPIISTSSTLFLKFTSDWNRRYQGFQFNYTSSSAGQCWDPGVPANGNRDNNSNFTSGQTVRYTCMDGYQLWGTANITCQPNGTWSGATPTCEDSSRIRLVGGSGPNEGRVEVRPADSFRWGTVCDDGFDLKDAEVVCRMLGYPNVYGIRLYAYFGRGPGPIYMEDLQCDGTESSLFNCSHKGWGIHDCSRLNVVGVVCDHSRIRLVGGSSRKEGRVEVRPADSMTWGTVCHNQFDIKDADVVCKMLDYPSAQLVRNDAHFGQGRGPIYMDNLHCNGDENILFNCSYPGWTINDLNCSHDQAAGVECTGKPFLLVSTMDGVFQMEVKDGSKVKMSSGSPRSLDYDPMTDFMYWTYSGIGRARRDGSGLETIVEFGANTSAWCLRLDHAGGNVYWGDNDGHISVARKDGSFVRTLLTLQGAAWKLVLDPRNG
ncbi:uncharacterized protein LOC144918544 [Branchiostoma floridae x Branchiostoma belcheri]